MTVNKFNASSKNGDDEGVSPSKRGQSARKSKKYEHVRKSVSSHHTKLQALKKKSQSRKSFKGGIIADPR